MSDNADILTNAAAAIEIWRNERGKLEGQMVELRSKLDVLEAQHEMLGIHIAQVEGAPLMQRRRGRRQWPVAVAEVPEHEPEPAA